VVPSEARRRRRGLRTRLLSITAQIVYTWRGAAVIMRPDFRVAKSRSEAVMRRVSFLLILSVLAVTARAEPLRIHGTTGYTGEFELNGSVSEQDLNGNKVFSGPLTVTHVGLCTRDGPRRPLAKFGSNSSDGRPASARRWTSTKANAPTRHFFRVIPRLHGLWS
jgi:hypothetical protein